VSSPNPEPGAPAAGGLPLDRSAGEARRNGTRPVCAKRDCVAENAEGGLRVSGGSAIKCLRKVIGALLCGILSLAMLNSSCSKRSELAKTKAEAKRGNSEAQFRLGAYYHDAVEVALDYQAAAIWFRRAAEQGHAAAQFALGETRLTSARLIHGR
jgi:Sel1 repeat-containing protein